MSNRGLKKGKSSEFDAQDDDHIKLGPALKVLSYEGFILTSKMVFGCKKCNFGVFSKSSKRPIFSLIDSESACPDLSNGVGIADDIFCFT